MRAIVIAVVLAVLLSAAGCSRPTPPDAGDGLTSEPENHPRTWHVQPDGADDAQGTAAAPLRTLARALAALRPGDTLMVGGGTYRERLRQVAVEPGTPDAPVVVRAVPGHRPVVAGLLWLRDADHWHISGVNVTWTAENEGDEHMVKFTGGTGWSFSEAEVWGARSYAAILVAGDASDFMLRGLYVHDTHPTNGKNQDHLIYLNSGRGGGIVEGNLLVGSANGRAVKIGPASADGAGVSGIVVRYNTMVDNRGPSNVQVAWTSSGNQIYRNVMVAPAPGRANVTAFELAGRGNVVRDNIGWHSAGVLETGVEGLVDGGGNRLLDPRFVATAARPFVPGNPAARAYGHTAACLSRVGETGVDCP